MPFLETHGNMKARYPRWFGSSSETYEALHSDDEEDEIASDSSSALGKAMLGCQQHRKELPTSPPPSPCCVTLVKEALYSPSRNLLPHRDELDLMGDGNTDTTANDSAELCIDGTWPTTLQFPALGSQNCQIDDAEESQCPDEVDDDGDVSIESQENMMYRTQYHVSTKQRSMVPASASPTISKTFGSPYHLGACLKSFETLETQPEESSETSVSSLASSLEDERGSPLILPPTARSVRWLDYVTDQPLATVHSIDSYEPASCRVVVVLHMNNGQHAPPDTNFEFLHCEFSCHERIKVCDVLEQIGYLTKSNRPFHALYYEGRELINAFALQDYPLEDGVSILVALRDGHESRGLLLAQSGILLSDRMLRQEIRKARIAGRSLQMLHSTAEWQERKTRQGGSENEATHHKQGEQFMFVASSSSTYETEAR